MWSKICKSFGLQTHRLRSIRDVVNNRVGHHQVRMVTASLLTQCTAKPYNKVAYILPVRSLQNKSLSTLKVKVVVLFFLLLQRADTWIEAIFLLIAEFVNVVI